MFAGHKFPCSKLPHLSAAATLSLPKSQGRLSPSLSSTGLRGRARTTLPQSDLHNMDITKFVVSHREKALLYGDYSTYWQQLSNKLLNCRKKLSIATKNRGKFNPKNNQ